MKFQNLFIAGLLLTTVTSASAAPSPRERAQRESLERENRDKQKERQQKAQDQTRTGVQEDASYRVLADLSKLSNGKVDTMQLDLATKTRYTVEVGDRSGRSSKAVEVNVADVSKQLSKNISDLQAQPMRDLAPNLQTLNTAKLQLGQASIQLLTLAAKKYSGSNADLVLARDAYARQIETAVKMTSRDSIATLKEINEHMEVVEAINQAKLLDPKLSDAEATLAGLRKSYEEGFDKRCGDGSCQKPSREVLEAGVKTRLKDLKDCG